MSETEQIENVEEDAVAEPNSTPQEAEQQAKEQVEQAEQIEEPEDSLPSVSIGDLTPRMSDATSRAGWSSLTPVQSKAMPYVMAGRPMMVQARTGSGKTGAFVLPLIELMNRRQDGTQALVLVPTRELATQVVDEAKMLFGDGGLRVTAVYGGVGYGPQLKALSDGTHLIVGTPGRVLDHLLRGSMSLKQIKVLVFDEADRMLSMGFYPDMRRIQEYLPNKTYTCMFSATFPHTVRSLARQFMDNPDFLGLSRDRIHVADTSHQTVTVSSMEKDRTLIRLIELENPDSAIIFCNTKQRVHYVSVVLQRFGYNADELSGDLAQKDREKVMGKLRRGELRFCVATDVAARGIDISDLSHVFQYEVPDDPEIYIHRAGRTGRAGATGVAITLVGDFTEQVQLKRIAKQYGIQFEERPSPDEAALAKVVAERMTVQLEAQMRDRDKLQVERLQRFVPMVQEMANDEASAALIAMLLDDYYQQSLHALPVGVEAPKPRKRQESQSGKSGKKRRNRSRSRGRSGNRS